MTEFLTGAVVIIIIWFICKIISSVVKNKVTEIKRDLENELRSYVRSEILHCTKLLKNEIKRDVFGNEKED